MQPTFTNFVRAACRAVASEGRGTGGALATIRVDFADRGRREPFARASRPLAAEALAHHGITSVHVGIAEPSVTRTPTAESALRELTGEEVFDAVVLVDGIGRAEVEAALPFDRGGVRAGLGRGLVDVRRLRPGVRARGGGRLSRDGLPTGSTRVLGIIGDPIAQARSPEVWSALFRLNGVDAVCVPMRVDASGLGAFLEGAKALRNFLGLIVTIPHKAASLGHVGSLTQRSALVGAVNMIRLDDEGKWTGDTVDGIGLVAGLRTRGQDPARRRALVVGVGGAGTAIAFALAEAGASEVAVFDVDRARADDVAARVAATGTTSYVAAPEAAGFELVVNASPLGMAPDDPVAIGLDGIEPGSVVADVVVHPRMTKLLQDAHARGCFTQPGVHMMDGQIAPMAAFLGLGEGAWDADAVARATGAA